MAASNSNRCPSRCPTVNRLLLPVKATYFFMFAATAVLMPYIPVYMRELGLTPTETAIIIGVATTAAGVARVGVGAIVDRYRRHGLVLTVCCVTAVASHVGLYFTPVEPGAGCPTTTEWLRVDVVCVDRGFVVCDRHDVSSGFGTDGAAAAQRFFESSFSDYDASYESVYPIDGQNNNNNNNNNNKPTYSSCYIDCCPANNYEVADLSASDYNDIRRYSNCENVSCSELIKAASCSSSFDSATCGSSVFLSSNAASINASCALLAFSNLNLSAGNSLNSRESICSLTESREQTVCSLNVTTISQDCPDLDVDSSEEEGKSTPFQRTFYIFLVFYLVGHVALNPAFSVVDSLVYVYLRDKGTDFGKERLWGTIAHGLFAFLSSWVIDLLDSGKTSDYLYAFVAFGVLFAIAAVTSFFYKKVPVPDRESPAAAGEDVDICLARKICRLVRSFTVDVVFVTMFVTGLFFGVHETFFFWFLQELGAAQIVFGVSLLVSSFMEILLLRFTARIIQLLGHRGCLYAVLALYTGRFLANSFIVNPWVAVATEATSGIGHGLLFPAASLWANSVAPGGLLGTIQGVMSALHFHAGKAVGTVIGGALYEAVGPRLMFRIFAAVGFVSIVLLVIVVEAVIIVRRRKRGKDSERQNGAPEFPKEGGFVSSVTHRADSTNNGFSDNEDVNYCKSLPQVAGRRGPFSFSITGLGQLVNASGDSIRPIVHRETSV